MSKRKTYRRKFESLKMNDEENIVSYFLWVYEVVNCPKGLGEHVKENMIVQKVFRYLINHFDAKVCSMEEIKYFDSLSVDELHGILAAYETRSENSTEKKLHWRRPRY